MSKSHPEYDDPAFGFCAYCQAIGVAAYRRPSGIRLRMPVLPFLPGATGRWHCARCGADGPRVDARKPLAEWAAFDAAMRVEPRRVHDARGRFKRVEPVAGRDGATHEPEGTAPAESDAAGGNVP